MEIEKLLSPNSVSTRAVVVAGSSFDVKVRDSVEKSIIVESIITTDDELNKSLIDDLSGMYQSPDRAIITITKKGSDIKSKLTDIENGLIRSISDNKAKQAEELAHMSEQAKKINPEPMQPDCYAFRGIGHRISADDIPKLYKDEDAYGGKSIMIEGSSGLPMHDTDSTTKDDQSHMRSYNQLSRNIARALAEIIYLNTIRGNLDDNKQVKLTVYQASILGF